MSKQIIDTPTWMELTSDMAAWYTEKSFPYYLWVGDENGNLSYNEEAQAIFNDTYDEVEEILSLHFIKGD